MKNETDLPVVSSSNEMMTPEIIREMINERAYFKAMKRGFEPGHEWEDWLEAEKEINNQCRYWRLG
ncbi:MAG: DUF2934 domain-containing protein [Gammaproteobacteria bacterium]